MLSYTISTFYIGYKKIFNILLDQTYNIIINNKHIPKLKPPTNIS